MDSHELVSSIRTDLRVMSYESNTLPKPPLSKLNERAILVKGNIKENTPSASWVINEIQSDFLKQGYERNTFQKHPRSQMR